MSTHFTAIETSEGLVQVQTKTRWGGFIPMPHTSVIPQGATDLRRLGTFIKWSTKEASRLRILHEAIVKIVRHAGPSGLVEIGNSIRITQRLASALGADWRDIVKQVTRDGVSFPIPDEVLKYVKNFA